MKKYLPEIGLLLISIVWGAGFVATKVIMDLGITPNQMITLRFFISAILLSTIFFKNLKNINKDSLKAGIIVGVFLFLAFILQTYGIKYTTPSKNGFITSVNVIIVPFIGFFIYKTKLDKLAIISSILTLIGIGVLSLQDDFTVNIGDVLTLICAFASAMQIFFAGKYTKDNDPIAISVVQIITVFVLSFIFLLVKQEVHIPMNKVGLTAILYLALFNTTIAFLLQNICLSKTSASSAAIILSTQAVFGTIFSIILLKEAVTLRLILGCTLIFISIIISETKLSFLNKSKNTIESEEI